MSDPEWIGPFRVLRKLGQGGMGAVYAVQDPGSPRALALKLILDQSSTPSALERFWREADLLARVQHRSVVRIHSVGQLAEGPYILEELIEGEPLTDLCQRGCPPRKAASLMRDLADAVATLHAQGILHRDLKPSNVMLSEGSIPVLLDFGISRDQTAETLTRTGALLGSPGTMAPEQANGERATPATDVYGLGVVLYGLLTGRYPFPEGGLLALKKVLSEEPPWPRALRADTPRELDAICRRAMAKRPEDRYPSAEAFGADLGRYLDGEPLEGQAARGRPWLAAAAVAAILAVGAVGAAVARHAAPPAPVPAATPAATPTPEASAAAQRTPAQQPLWTLRAGQELELLAKVEEEGQGFRSECALRLRLRVLELGSDGLARLEARVAELQLRVGPMASWGSGTSMSFDSQAPPAPHPFMGLRAAIDVPWSLSLDPTTGAASRHDGLEELSARAKAVDSPPALEAETGKIPAKVLGPEFLPRALFCFRVLAQRSLWRARTPGAYVLEREQLGRPELMPLLSVNTGNIYRLRGKATWAAGLFRSGSIAQERGDPASDGTFARCQLELRSPPRAAASGR